MDYPLDEEVSGAEAICRVLEDNDIDLVFGLPGGDIMALFDALCDHRDSIRTVLARDEAQAAVVAEAYGRVAGKPAALVAQGAWILSKAGAGVIEALTGSSPMLGKGRVFASPDAPVNQRDKRPLPFRASAAQGEPAKENPCLDPISATQDTLPRSTLSRSQQHGR